MRRAAEADATRLARLIAEIAVEFRERGAGWTTAVEGLTAAVVALTARLLASSSPGQARGHEAELHGRFRALLESAYGEHRPVGWYGSALGVSESRLDRAARAVAGKWPARRSRTD